MNDSRLYEKYKNLSKNQLNNELVLLCREGDIKKINYLLTSPELTEHPDFDHDNNHIFISLFYGIKFNIICYSIFELNIKKDKIISNLLKEDHSMNHQNKFASLVKKLFNIREVNKELKKEKNQKTIKTDYSLVADLNDALTYACHFGNISNVKYFLTSSDLIVKANVHGVTPEINEAAIEEFKISFPQLALKKTFSVNKPLITAFEQNHFHIVDYLLTSPELKEHANINLSSHELLKNGIQDNNIERISSLIFDYGIEKNDSINEMLNDYRLSRYKDMVQQVDRMFIAKQTHDELNGKLSSKNNELNKKLKL